MEVLVLGPVLARAFRLTLFFGCSIIAVAPDIVLLGQGSMVRELYGGLVDSIAIFLLFVLLLRGEGEPAVAESVTREAPSPGPAWPAALAAGAIVAVTFGGMRLALDLALDAGPSGSTPLAWFASAGLIGFWIGATYVWLPWKARRAVPGALRYTSTFFAPAWLGGAVFAPLFVNVGPVLAVIFAGDVLAVVAGLAVFRRVAPMIRPVDLAGRG